jgi:hypothetical protein
LITNGKIIELIEEEIDDNDIDIIVYDGVTETTWSNYVWTKACG